MLFLYAKEPPTIVFTWFYKQEGCPKWTLPETGLWKRFDEKRGVVGDGF